MEKPVIKSAKPVLNLAAAVGALVILFLTLPAFSAPVKQIQTQQTVQTQAQQSIRPSCNSENTKLSAIKFPSIKFPSLKFPRIKLPKIPGLEQNSALARPSIAKRQENYIEITNSLHLNERELSAFKDINTKEKWAVRPIALDLEAKYLRLDELNNTKCRFYQRTCKKNLKADKKFLADDIKELRRQIRQKKEYYKILYLNETTRRQDLKLREMVNKKTNYKPQLW